MSGPELLVMFYAWPRPTVPCVFKHAAERTAHSAPHWSGVLTLFHQQRVGMLSSPISFRSTAGSNQHSLDDHILNGDILRLQRAHLQIFKMLVASCLSCNQLLGPGMSIPLHPCIPLLSVSVSV